MQQIEIYEYTTQIKFWSFCNVHLCIHQQNHFSDQTNTHKMVCEGKNHRRDGKRRFVNTLKRFKVCRRRRRRRRRRHCRRHRRRRRLYLLSSHVSGLV